ncbi:MAG: EAL domain-containing protein [Candidatus Doudnabacteria bacterium]
MQKKYPLAPRGNFPIVGIGASAGGLETFLELLSYLPPRSNMAYVLVQHLDPHHESYLQEILSKKTSIPILEAKNNMPVSPNTVYVIPPNKNITIKDRILYLTPRKMFDGQHMPIDIFFRSLADDSSSSTPPIGVILSGTGSDGTLGISEIKSVGGITIAQDLESAKYNGMPQSAIASGNVDHILSAKNIGKELGQLAKNGHLAKPEYETAQEFVASGNESMHKILNLLRIHTSVDFANYKYATIKRRIERRMTLNKMESYKDYVEFIKSHPQEISELYDEILITVTRFFREPEGFKILEHKVWPALVKNKPPDKPVRIWVPGCSTGEEAYSIAISLSEYLKKREIAIPVQIFATDVSDKSLARAREGIYIENIALDVSPERLERFFHRVENGFQISKQIREMCVFAKQNLIKDPPFSFLDFISCQNLLIYMGPALHHKIFPVFHFALKPGGFLKLGTAETTGSFSDLFVPIDKKHKIYSKNPLANPAAITSFNQPLSDQRHERDLITADTVTQQVQTAAADNKILGVKDAQAEADRLIVNNFAPAGILINNKLEVIQFRGQTRPYLEMAPGKASFSLLKMVAVGLFSELSQAVDEAKKTKKPFRKENVGLTINGSHRNINIEVLPIGKNGAYFLILFEESSAQAAKVKKNNDRRQGPRSKNQTYKQLEQEVSSTRKYLQELIENHEAANEELMAANEEIMSSNEELQSTNEELETAKEELQSTNEELTTVNEEVQHRNSELGQLSEDLVNLLSTVDIPVVMLEHDLTVRRFTPTAVRILRILPSDIGRPITDIKSNLKVPNMEELLREVIITGTPYKKDVQDLQGTWHSLQIHPSRSHDNKINGTVITLIDIDKLKTSLEYIEAVFDTVREPLLVLDGDLRIKEANSAFYATFKLLKKDVVGQPLYTIEKGQWNIPRLRKLLEEILPEGKKFHDLEIEHDFPNHESRTMLLNARAIPKDGERSPGLILLAIEDISQRQRELSSLIQNSSDFISLVLPEGKILFLNGGGRRLVGNPRGSNGNGKRMTIFDYFMKADREKLEKDILPAIVLGENWTGELQLKHLPTSTPIVTEMHIFAISDPKTKRSSAIAVVARDVRERKQSERTIHHQAFHDTLTNLPNRKLLEDRLGMTLNRAKRHKERVGIIFLDLDQFKTINDTLGHSVGDELLKKVGERLGSCIRREDTLSRWGGDEFIILLINIRDDTQTVKVAEKITAALKPAFKINNHTLHVGASMGIALYPEDGKDIHTLLKNADTALYRSKESARSKHLLYNQGMSERTSKKLAIETALRTALSRKELKIFYQPVINVKDGTLMSVEALIRWQHPKLGLILPREFIAAAEDTGAIIAIDDWVLKTAGMQLKKWHKLDLPDLKLAVNLSAHQFTQANLVKKIASTLHELKLKPAFIELEITESIAMHNLKITTEQLERLKKLGFEISIDDFGIGYSSLSYLNRFPLNNLKIDRSFIKDCLTSEQDAEIVRAIISMAHNLKLKVIAEGVETKEQLEFLASQKCEGGQGKLFSPAIDAASFTKWIKEKYPMLRSE